MLRASAAAAVAALAAVLATAAAGGGRAEGVPATGEVVLGTLTRPPSAAFLGRVRAGEMGGVLLLGHWRAPAVLAGVTRGLQAAACTRGEPLLVAADQEGGVVRRLAWAPPTLAPAAMGSAATARGQAADTAIALRRAGVDVDLAPVVDSPSSARSFLGTRAFARSPRAVAPLAAAFVQGLQDAGIAATAKHFPGLGEASANTDDLPVVVRAAGWKLRAGLLPFRAAIAAGAKLVMVSSASYPALDASGLPAVYSPALVGSLLRGDLGFDGVVVTDALDAPGAAAFGHPATRAVAAGVDLVLFGSEAASERAQTELARDARVYPRLRARLADSAARIRALKDWLAAHGGPSCP